MQEMYAVYRYMKYDNLANTMATLWEVVKKMADYH